MYKQPTCGQLNIFGEEVQEQEKKKVFHIYATDRYDHHMEADVKAYTFKQACYLFRKEFGWQWTCH